MVSLRLVVVPGTGLEPARVAPLAPKASVSTNFTTPADLLCHIKAWASLCQSAGF